MGYRVLAVDDSSTVRAIIAKSLRLSGVEVSRFDEASSGEEGLALLRAGGFDLVFCDLNMPGMTGFELVESMRRDGLLERVAVVIVTSLGDCAALEELMAKGVRAYLRKPLRPEQLRRLMNNVMGVKHESQS